MLSNLLSRKFFGLALDELAALLVFVTIGSLAVYYHEPWADEAQAWLLARDLSIPAVLSQMHYEGSPPLWHLLLWPLIRLHLPYSAYGLVSLILMGGAMYLWLRCSAVPRGIRLLVPFSFYFQYQYAVVARSYSLSTFLAFAAVALWRAKPSRILELSLLIALLAQTNLFGFTLAVGIAIVRAAEYFQASRQQRPSRRQAIEAIFATVLVVTSLAVAKILSTPAPDCSYEPVKWQTKVASLSPSQFLGSEAFFKTFDLSADGGALLFFLVVLWFVIIRKRVYVLPLVLTLIPMGIVWWKPWHSGMILAALLVCLWTAWPRACSPEMQLPGAEFWTLALKVCFVLILVFQLPSTLAAVRNDVRGPYSGAKAAAEFLRPYVGKRPIYTYGYRPVALLPYFPTNIYANRAVTFWIWNEEHAAFSFEIDLPHGALVVARSRTNTITDPLGLLFERHHFQKKQTFCGQLFWFDRVYQHDCYDIYEQEGAENQQFELKRAKASGSLAGLPQ